MDVEMFVLLGIEEKDRKAFDWKHSRKEHIEREGEDKYKVEQRSDRADSTWQKA